MYQRTVRSFVTRAGRLTPAQQQALVELWPRFGLLYGDQLLELGGLFGRAGPCTLEIGFGNGEHLLARAQAEPERNFLGIEVHRPGIGQLLRAAAAADLSNLRIIAHDAVEVLQSQIAPGTLDEVQILFPDPWPKKRHHKRRLIQPEFATALALRLRPGGLLQLATDWAPYAEHMRAVLDACPLLAPAEVAAGAARAASVVGAAAASGRTATRFERRGLRLGHVVSELIYLRGAPSADPRSVNRP